MLGGKSSNFNVIEVVNANVPSEPVKSFDKFKGVSSSEKGCIFNSSSSA